LPASANFASARSDWFLQDQRFAHISSTQAVLAAQVLDLQTGERGLFGDEPDLFVAQGIGFFVAHARERQRGRVDAATGGSRSPILRPPAIAPRTLRGLTMTKAAQGQRGAGSVPSSALAATGSLR
jgi:hypothetical protein